MILIKGKNCMIGTLFRIMKATTSFNFVVKYILDIIPFERMIENSTFLRLHKF